MTGLPPPGGPGGPGGPGSPDGTDGTGAPDGQPDPPTGTLRPTSGGVLAAWTAAGLVGGWLLRPVSVEVLGAAPVVQWRQVLGLVLVAAVLAGTTWLTWRRVHVHRLRLAPHLAVNRLVLARACALAGALVAGAYGGYAISWLGLGSERAPAETVRSLVAATAGVAVVALALLLERACRVRSEDPEP